MNYPETMLINIMFFPMRAVSVTFAGLRSWAPRFYIQSFSQVIHDPL
jgi:hypothetical protein